MTSRTLFKSSKKDCELCFFINLVFISFFIFYLKYFFYSIADNGHYRYCTNKRTANPSPIHCSIFIFFRLHYKTYTAICSTVRHSPKVNPDTQFSTNDKWLIAHHLAINTIMFVKYLRTRFH